MICGMLYMGYSTLLKVDKLISIFWMKSQTKKNVLGPSFPKRSSNMPLKSAIIC